MNQNNFSVITGWDYGNDICLVLKQDHKTIMKKISNIDWYFVITRNDYEKLGKTQYFKRFNDEVKQKIVKKIRSNPQFVYIICTYTSRNELTQQLINSLKKKNIIVYEADLSRTKRYLIDTDAQIEGKDLNILYFDIETDDIHGTGLHIGKNAILSWAACDKNGKKWFFCIDDEKKLLSTLLSLFNKYDVIIGWNSVKFDIPYIQKRMEKYQLHYNWRTKIHVDLMRRCIKLYTYEMEKIGLTGFSLDEVARVFLNMRKIDKPETTRELFDNNQKKLKQYNIHDTILLQKLDEKLEIIELMIHECVWTGTTLDKFYVGELLDNYMLRKAKKLGMHLLSKPDDTEKARTKDIKILGGYVKEPITGLYENVRIFDFKSLYPSIILSWNIGFDSLDIEKTKQGDITLKSFLKNRDITELEFYEWYSFLKKEKKRLDPKNECYQTANNNFFRNDKNSFISTLIEGFLNTRAKMKKRLIGLDPSSSEYGSVRSAQWIVKELSNSMFGITADKSSRYFNKNIAESITLTGQFLNKTASAILEKVSKQQVIYTDTDSCFIPLPGTHEEIEKFLSIVNTKLNLFLNKTFQLQKNTVLLDYEKAYKKMIMLDKKKYTGQMMWLNSKDVKILFSKGLEDVRKNTIQITKKALHHLITLITFDNAPLKDIEKWLITLKEYVLTSNEIKKEDITINTRVSKPTYKYASKTAHVRLAENLIKRGKLIQPTEEKTQWGTRISYIISESMPKQIAIQVDDFNGEWDRVYYWNTLIYAPIKRIFQVLDPSQDWSKYEEEHSVSRQKRLKRENLKIQREILIAERQKIKEKRKKEIEETKKSFKKK